MRPSELVGQLPVDLEAWYTALNEFAALDDEGMAAEIDATRRAARSDPLRTVEEWHFIQAKLDLMKALSALRPAVRWVLAGSLPGIE